MEATNPERQDTQINEMVAVKQRDTAQPEQSALYIYDLLPAPGWLLVAPREDIDVTGLQSKMLVTPEQVKKASPTLVGRVVATGAQPESWEPGPTIIPSSLIAYQRAGTMAIAHNGTIHHLVRYAMVLGVLTDLRAG